MSKWIGYVFLVSACFMVETAYSSGSKIKGTVNLQAQTKNGSPLMKPVEWKIYHVSKEGSRQLSVSFSRHTGPVSLLKGRYVATVFFRSRLYESTFEVKPEDTVEVAIELDTDS